MEESQWWRLAVKEFIFDLWDEHVLLRRNASIHNSQFAYFIPLVWRKRFDDLSIVNLTEKQQYNLLYLKQDHQTFIC